MSTKPNQINLVLDHWEGPYKSVSQMEYMERLLLTSDNQMVSNNYEKLVKILSENGIVQIPIEEDDTSLCDYTVELLLEDDSGTYMETGYFGSDNAEIAREHYCKILKMIKTLGSEYIDADLQNYEFCECGVRAENPRNPLNAWWEARSNNNIIAKSEPFIYHRSGFPGSDQDQMHNQVISETNASFISMLKSLGWEVADIDSNGRVSLMKKRKIDDGAK